MAAAAADVVVGGGVVCFISLFSFKLINLINTKCNIRIEPSKETEMSEVKSHFCFFTLFGNISCLMSDSVTISNGYCSLCLEHVVNSVTFVYFY